MPICLSGIYFIVQRIVALEDSKEPNIRNDVRFEEGLHWKTAMPAILTPAQGLLIGLGRQLEKENNIKGGAP